MPITLCEHLISDNVSYQCDNPIFTGLEPVGYLCNKSDIASFTKANSIVSAITMKTGKKMYKIYAPGKTPFNGTTTTFVEGKTLNKFDKTVAFVVLENGPSVVESVIEPLANGSFVAVIENSWASTNGNSKFEIFGLDKGLKASEVSNDKYGEDADGGWNVTMVESGTPNPATFVFDTDIDTTRALLEGLC